jgi:hypothetical protein
MEVAEVQEPLDTSVTQEVNDATTAVESSFTQTPTTGESAQELPSVVAEVPETIATPTVLIVDDAVSTFTPRESWELLEPLATPRSQKTVSTPTDAAPAFAETLPLETSPVQSPVAEIPATYVAAELPEELAVRSALLENPVASTVNGLPAASRAAKQKKSLFSIGKKAEKKPMPVKAAKAEKPARGAKTKKPVFARPPKAEKVSKKRQPLHVAGAPTESALKKATSWLFGAPKQNVKPSEKQTLKRESLGADLNPASVASRDAQIEKLRGSSLEIVDTTLVDVNAEGSTPSSEPEFLTAGEAPKANARKAPAAKKPRTTASEPDSKEEAA